MIRTTSFYLSFSLISISILLPSLVLGFIKYIPLLFLENLAVFQFGSLIWLVAVVLKHLIIESKYYPILAFTLTWFITRF